VTANKLAAASLVFTRKIGRKLRAAAALKQIGDRIFGSGCPISRRDVEKKSHH